MSVSASEAVITSPPRALQVLVGRCDRAAFEPQGDGARVRLALARGDAWDVLLERGAAHLERAGDDADATLMADSQTWAAIADVVGGGMRAFGSGGLAVRRNSSRGGRRQMVVVVNTGSLSRRARQQLNRLLVAAYCL